MVRHNLGLEEAIFTVALSAGFALLARRPRFAGFYLGLLPLLYAPYRFVSDFARVRDARYLGLTPAQYGTVALLVLGVGILVLGQRRAQARRDAQGTAVDPAARLPGQPPQASSPPM